VFQDRLGETRHEWIYILIGNPPTLLYPCCASNVAMDFGFRPVASCVGILTLIFALRGVFALSIWQNENIQPKFTSYLIPDR